MLERREIAAAGELQSMARLAEAYLRQDRADRVWRFRKLLVLAACDAVTRSKFRPSNLPIPGVSWESAQHEELAARAQRWLEVSTL